MYAGDGAIPLKTPVTPGDPFLGRIKDISVPPPRIVKIVKCSIATVENIKDGECTSLFLTPNSESPMDDAERIIILNGTGPGSTPQEPLALVANMSDSERSALESEGRCGLASDAEPDTATSEIQYRTSIQDSRTFLFVLTSRLLGEVYYLLYADAYAVPSKVTIDREVPSVGRIRVDSVAPPHSPTSIKRCISRAEGNPALVHADLFADTSCDTPLKEGNISIFRTDGPGLSPDKPMAIVQLQTPSIPDGKYVIKNRVKDLYWTIKATRIVYLDFTTIEDAKRNKDYQVNKHSPIIIQVFRG